jgi:hypothetical protein
VPSILFVNKSPVLGRIFRAGIFAMFFGKVILIVLAILVVAWMLGGFLRTVGTKTTMNAKHAK